MFAKALPLLVPQTVEQVQTRLDEEQRKISNIENKNESLTKKLEEVSQLIGMADLINSKKDWDEAKAFFQELRWRKELRNKEEANRIEQELNEKVSQEVNQESEEDKRV